jgi:hypothetical protein
VALKVLGEVEVYDLALAGPDRAADRPAR